MNRVLILLIAVVSICASTSPAFAEAKLKAAKIQFHTGEDDKDRDTKLSVWVSVGNTIAARLEGFANDNNRFAEKSSSEIFNLRNVDPTITKSAAANGIKTRLLMETKDGGDDNWWVKWTVTLEFDDNSSLAFPHKAFERYDDDEHTDGTYEDKPE